MMREEFNKLVSEKMYDGKPFDVGNEDYEVIETVYNFHPAISGTDGKIQVADLYINFGYIVFLDMLPRALAIQNIESEEAVIKASLSELERKKTIVQFGNLEDIH